MTQLDRLKQIKSLRDLARLLGVQPKALSYVLYKHPPEEKYTIFTIPKKSGGLRTIKAPCPQLKLIQSRLSSLLTACFHEIEKSNNRKKPISHGFRSDCSIITNASSHVRKRHVFNVDLEDFFQNINFGRVRGYFIKDKNFLLDEDVATVIAQIACIDNGLPQGSPCSPVISNLIGRILDVKLVAIAKKYGCDYTRYADDLSFSTSQICFPQEIACNVGDNKWCVGERLAKTIESSGFSINENKVSMQHRYRRQIATGLVVNQKVNIKKEYYRKTRTMCNSLFKNDKYYIDDCAISGNFNQLNGILNYVYDVKIHNDNKSHGEKHNNPKGILRLYRYFLFYRNFFAITKPLIICEGITDYIYLKCALQSLIDYYPDFITKDEEKYSYHLNFFEFTKKFMNIVAIGDGSSGLFSLLNIYDKNMSRFHGDGKEFPVILIVDNDDGATEIKKKLKIKGEHTEPYYHYNHNIYVIFISADGKTGNVSIEDLFDNDVLVTQVGEKKFNKNNSIDIGGEYGKVVFANKVVKENRATINFYGFISLFDTVREVCRIHANR